MGGATISMFLYFYLRNKNSTIHIVIFKHNNQEMDFDT